VFSFCYKCVCVLVLLATAVTDSHCPQIAIGFSHIFKSTVSAKQACDSKVKCMFVFMIMAKTKNNKSVL
jgi:hypothetical protein